MLKDKRTSGKYMLLSGSCFALYSLTFTAHGFFRGKRQKRTQLGHS